MHGQIQGCSDGDLAPLLSAAWCISCEDCSFYRCNTAEQGEGSTSRCDPKCQGALGAPCLPAQLRVCCELSPECVYMRLYVHTRLSPSFTLNSIHNFLHLHIYYKSKDMRDCRYVLFSLCIWRVKRMHTNADTLLISACIPEQTAKNHQAHEIDSKTQGQLRSQPCRCASVMLFPVLESLKTC